MGSSYFGEPKLGGNERSGGSSRKGKKSSNNSDKPKQPQRGLGVAQLEKIRLHSQMGSNYLPNSLHASTINYPTTSFNQQQENMRLQMAYSHVPSSSSSSYAFHGQRNTMMGWGELERTNIRYGDSQPSTAARWDNTGNGNGNGNGNLEMQQFAQPSMSTKHLLMNLQVEDSPQDKRKKDRSNISMGSSSHNYSGSSDDQEVDLELRLSL